jgi:thiamine biosynthesis lipoprotein
MPRPAPPLVVLAALATLAPGFAAAASPLQVTALDATLLDRPARLEVAGMEREAAESLMRQALADAEAAAGLAAAGGDAEGGLGRLNAAAGGEAQAVDPELLEVLARALDFCRWSDGAHGPLGGHLHRLWGLSTPASSLPAPPALADATRSAACSGLEIDRRRGTAKLARGGLLDLWGFAAGWAVDRALASLRAGGASNARVAVAGVQRAVGPGPDGRGWYVILPVFPGLTQPLDELWLRDRALAVRQRQDRPLRIAGAVFAPYIDQRSGRPVEGVVAVVTVTETALDADALATALFVLGSRGGEMRLGVLHPSPSVTWVLGSADSAPLIHQHRWSVLKTP